MGVHHSAILETEARPGPGRGPAPAGGRERFEWKRWVVYDSALWDDLEAMSEENRAALMARWPEHWPSPESGLMSIRQIRWCRDQMIRGLPPSQEYKR